MNIPPLSPMQIYNLSEISYWSNQFDPAYIEAKITPHTGLQLTKHSCVIVNGVTGMSLPLNSGMGFIARLGGARSSELVIATRGTSTFSDLGTDVYAAPLLSPTGHWVHAGFLKTFNSYMEQLKLVLSHKSLGFRPTAIHCMGHSLGGALANLNAATCAELGFNVFLYSIAAPRVGTLPFAEHLSGKIPAEQVFRVANYSDPITFMPCFPFVHAPFLHGHYLLEGNLVVNPSEHAMESGYVQMRSSSWRQMQSSTLALQGRLQFEIEQLIQNVPSKQDLLGRLILHSTIHNSRALKGAGYLINRLSKEAGGQHLLSMTYYSTGAFSALDQVAEILLRAPGMSAQEEMRLVVGLIDKFLGRLQRTATNLSAAILREALHLLGNSLMQMAQQAIQQNLRM